MADSIAAAVAGARSLPGGPLAAAVRPSSRRFRRRVWHGTAGAPSERGHPFAAAWGEARRGTGAPAGAGTFVGNGPLEQKPTEPRASRRGHSGQKVIRQQVVSRRPLPRTDGTLLPSPPAARSGRSEGAHRRPGRRPPARRPGPSADHRRHVGTAEEPAEGTTAGRFGTTAGDRAKRSRLGHGASALAPGSSFGRDVRRISEPFPPERGPRTCSSILRGTDASPRFRLVSAPVGRSASPLPRPEASGRHATEPNA